MTVKQAVAYLAYGEAFYLKSAYNGKILYRSQKNKKDKLERFLNLPCTDTPYFTDLCTTNSRYSTPFAYPVIGIWVSDYGMDGGQDDV